MVMDIQHRLKYVIEFIEPVDYFDVILQKQINLRLKFIGDSNSIQIVEFGDNNTDNNDRLYKSNFMSKYKQQYIDYSLYRKSFLELVIHHNKNAIISEMYQYSKSQPYYNRTGKSIVMSYEEFEYSIDLMLEEFKLFTNTFEFNENEKKIIDAFVLDEKIKSNIKFIGWKDYWISV